MQQACLLFEIYNCSLFRPHFSVPTFPGFFTSSIRVVLDISGSVFYSTIYLDTHTTTCHPEMQYCSPMWLVESLIHIDSSTIFLAGIVKLSMMETTVYQPSY